MLNQTITSKQTNNSTQLNKLDPLDKPEQLHQLSQQDQPNQSDTEELTLSEIISTSKLPVVLAITAPWCPSCRKIAPEFEKFTEEYQDHIITTKLTIETKPALKNQDLINLKKQFDIDFTSIPTFVVFNNNQVITVLQGSDKLSQVRKIICTLIQDSEHNTEKNRTLVKKLVKKK